MQAPSASATRPTQEQAPGLANIKVVGSGGLEKTVTVTQAAATAAVFDVSPNSRSVTAVPGTTTFTVSPTVGWSIESVLPQPSDAGR